jgi:hypothetical protein
MAFVKVLAIHFSQAIFVVVNQVVLLGSRCVRIEGWDHEVAGSTANGACSIMVLRCAFIVSRSPVSDAFQTENMVTAVEKSNCLTFFENGFETDLTLSLIITIVFRF